MLIGDPTLKRSKVSLKAMIRVLRKEGRGILVEFNEIENCLKELAVPCYLESLFTDFSDIFTQNLPLPLQRTQDHAIPLKEGTDPINVRPYRYPHSQNNEIEHMVQDMLKAGIINPPLAHSLVS